MKILAIGDPHGKLPKNLDSIIGKNKIEAIICTGDVSITPKNPIDPNSWKGIKQKSIISSYTNILNKLASYKKPVLTLRGNMHMSEIRKNPLRRLFRNKKYIYHKVNGKIGILGKNFVLFDVAYEEHNSRSKKACEMIKSNKFRESKLNKLLKENKNSILISHNPPYGKVDEVKNKLTKFKKKHVGSKILLRAIKKYHPKLVLCGHIHEAKGEAKIGKTKVINLGCCGDYKIIEV